MGTANSRRTLFHSLHRRGTPTILTPGQLDRILTKLAAAFNFEPGFEFTVEANPGTLTPEKAQALAQAGANRISLGAQAFDDGLLQKIGRAHTVGQIHESVGLIRKAGIDNINLDLIEGLPGQSLINGRPLWPKQCS